LPQALPAVARQHSVSAPWVWENLLNMDGTAVAALVEERQAEIKGIVCEILEIEPDDLTETSLFAEEHTADSLRAIEILAALEKRFNIVIDQSELARMKNLFGVYEVVADAVGE
jgi:acyl carrier protein